MHKNKQADNPIPIDKTFIKYTRLKEKLMHMA